jgi:DNA-binding transcriptional LysR family regulator
LTVVPSALASCAPPGVELRHLRYFVAIAEAGSFTEAAERVFIAQPTLSQQLRRLEDIIGTRLVHRRRDGVRLTRAGEVLLETARTILSLVDHGISDTRRAAGLGPAAAAGGDSPRTCPMCSPWRPSPGSCAPLLPPTSR